MHILDSSAWLECLEAGPNTVHFRPIFLQIPQVLVPAVIITEVRKVILRQRSPLAADTVTRSLQSCRVVPIDAAIASSAADLAIQYKLPLADSVIYAVALAENATLWTQDAHFEGLPQVRYFAKKPPKVK